MNEILEQEKSAAEMERNELNLLMQRGMAFGVTVKVRRRAGGIRGFLGKTEAAEELMNFEIQQPTLSTLDRISDVSLAMVVNSDELTANSDEVVAKARGLVKDNARRLARVVAIAALGEGYYITEVAKSGKITRRANDKELDRLTDLFFHAVKPSQLVGLASAITSISNLADFIASMRLLSGARTTETRKNRVE
ncbi:MAG: hypothetical protein LBJ57_02705 [Prevotellaceae bacterium]|jgi:hypothetical protein|nr:hypothetical protein [Prevotellaceae bacterium]